MAGAKETLERLHSYFNLHLQCELDNQMLKASIAEIIKGKIAEQLFQQLENKKIPELLSIIEEIDNPSPQVQLMPLDTVQLSKAADRALNEAAGNKPKRGRPKKDTVQ